LFQTIEKNAEAELERLTRNTKLMTDQLQATYANDLRTVEKRLKTEQVMWSFLWCTVRFMHGFVFTWISFMQNMFCCYDCDLLL